MNAPGPVARTVDRLATRALGLPGARTGYTVGTERVPVRDGVVLLATHFAPDTGYPLGTVLVRTPYGRDSPLDVVSARTLAARGYHVLVQSCRGTFGSGGVFEPMVNEVDDGLDTVAWLRTQAWFDGRLATMGLSYLGWTQWALMTDPPPELKASVVVVGPHDFAEVTHGRGAFTLNDFLGWSAMMATQEDGGLLRRLARNVTGRRAMTRAYAGLPLVDAAEPVLHGGAAWYRGWASHPDRTDPFWDARRVTTALDNAAAPVLLIGGWQDLFLDQTLLQYATLRGRGAEVALTVGPWTHLQAGVSREVAQETLGWLDEHLAGVGTRPSPVRVHVTGAGEWRDLPEWPPPTAERVWHAAAGNALLPDGADVPAPATRFRYDPADPTPTVGGRLLTAGAGVQDNAALEARSDVVVFTGEPLGADLEVVGEPTVELVHSTDNPYADVFVRLCDVDARGRSRNVTDVLLRLDPDRGSGPVRLVLDACAHRFAAGHRLRLLVAGGSHPRFARNLGTGEPAAESSRLVPSVHTLGGARLTLPVTS
ncbi:CocE/NonD family hydrolase [Pseudonocardia abyssalis]|uniref:CocE/NonD family hydrolase n=3 Tax=Pseudonocardia abyssalis TaxID=2792008 RepID=A0ABS6UN18_9PSEU|nr:CocE/NonD family hydrolase [Pseudonocardia abyssalis]MBW0133592.1 CocE/NonD family hydrolase [Pseudonocardia abyssalis]